MDIAFVKTALGILRSPVARHVDAADVRPVTKVSSRSHPDMANRRTSLGHEEVVREGRRTGTGRIRPVFRALVEHANGVGAEPCTVVASSPRIAGPATALCAPPGGRHTQVSAT